MKKLAGIFPAIVSPCDERDNFAEDAFAAVVKFLYAHDVHGLYLCGGTGDGLRMSLAERKRAVEIAAELSLPSGKQLIVQVAAASTREAVALAEHAAANKAAAISSLAPPLVSFEHLVTYYQDLHQACRLPVLVYYIPMLTGQPQLSVEQLLRLLDLDGVRGLKITDWNMFYIHRLRLRRPETIIFNGMDECLYWAMLAGADGGIGMWYNLFPRLFVAIYQAMRQGNHARAGLLQAKGLDIADLYWAHGVKEVFELLMRQSGLAEHCYRKPLQVMNFAAAQKVEKQIKERIKSMEAALEN